MTEFKVPELGENVESADVPRVLVNVGDTIEHDQPVLELETDKATIEVPSSVAGVIKEIKVKKGEKVQVGAVVSHGGGWRLGKRRKRNRQRTQPPRRRPPRTEPARIPAAPCSGEAAARSGSSRRRSDVRQAARPQGPLDAAAGRGATRRRSRRAPPPAGATIRARAGSAGVAFGASPGA